MKIRFTHHAKVKVKLIQSYDFPISNLKVIDTVTKPEKLERRVDGTYIATSLLDEAHVLRVVYKRDNGIIIIITCYPGRRKAYGL